MQRPITPVAPCRDASHRRRNYSSLGASLSSVILRYRCPTSSWWDYPPTSSERFALTCFIHYPLTIQRRWERIRLISLSFRFSCGTMRRTIVALYLLVGEVIWFRGDAFKWSRVFHYSQHITSDIPLPTWYHNVDKWVTLEGNRFLMDFMLFW